EVSWQKTWDNGRADGNGPVSPIPSAAACLTGNPEQPWEDQPMHNKIFSRLRLRRASAPVASAALPDGGDGGLSPPSLPDRIDRWCATAVTVGRTLVQLTLLGAVIVAVLRGHLDPSAAASAVSEVVRTLDG